MTVCKRICYRGRVQGVGFRYTARGLARGYPIAGYVRNLPTGEVDLAAEGEETDVQAFLDALARQMVDHIQEQTVTDEPPQGYKGFVIRT
jgi:acylphosphatase